MIFTTPFLPIDGLTFFMLVLIAVLAPLIFIYSLSYVRRNLFRYYFVLFLTLGSMIGAVLARDLLSFYIFLEMMTVGIYFLIIDNTKKESFPAGFKYILMMFAGGLFILAATLMLYNLTGTFDMSVIAGVAGALPLSSVALIFLLFAIGCLFEMGAVPFHVWLPDAHPIAPSPVSALLSGLVIKVGVYALIRILFTLQLYTLGLVFIGAICMLFGVILALRQTNVKRLLAYSSISQIGYILLGIGIGSGLGLTGAMFHILNHATFKMLLFLCIGAVIYATQKRELENLGGLGKRMPITFATFIVAALAISGIPPFNGFASKVLLSEAVSNNSFLKFIMIFTAAGTFAALFKLFRHVFLGELPAKLKSVKEVPFLMRFSMFVLAGLCLVIGLFPQQVLSELIYPATNVLISYEFYTPKLLLDTLLIVVLGSLIYVLGMKSSWLKIKKSPNRIPFYLSLDKIYCSIAVLVETLCNMLKKVMRRSLNVYVFWIFLTLVFLFSVLNFLKP